MSNFLKLFLKIGLIVGISYFGIKLMSSKIFAKESEKKSQRIYVTDENDPFGPVEIKKLKESKSEVFLKDPADKITTGEGPVQKIHPKKIENPPKLNYTPKKLNFKGIAINGRISKPRIDFKREHLNIKRAEDITRVDFFDRVFHVPANDEL